MTYDMLVEILLAGFSMFATEEHLPPTDERVRRVVKLAKGVADTILAAGATTPEEVERILALLKKVEAEAKPEGVAPNMPRAKA